MKKFSFYLPAILAGLLMLGACEKDYLTPKQVDVTVPVSFATDIIPILAARCATQNCHDAGPQSSSPSLLAADAFTGLEQYIDRDNPADSRVYKMIIGTSTPVMPLEPNPRLTPEQIGYIFAWIEQGGQNN